MPTELLILLITACILLLVLEPKSELFSDMPKSHILLYDNFTFENPYWQFPDTIQYDVPASLSFKHSSPNPIVDSIVKDSGFINYTFPMPLKSLDVKLHKHNDGRDCSRYIEIYSVYPNSPVASSSSGTTDWLTLTSPGYDAYTPKFHKILSIRPGQHVKSTLDYPVKMVLVKAQL